MPGSGRPPKLSCLDCHQSSKSMKNRKFVDCTDPKCCLKDLDEEIEEGAEANYQINRFCHVCLENNYGYVEADCAKDSFVCPRCKGIENPNKRARSVTPKARPVKRVNNAEIVGELVMLRDPAFPDSAARLPALRLVARGVTDFAKALSEEQRKELAAQMPGVLDTPTPAPTPSATDATDVTAAAPAAEAAPAAPVKSEAEALKAEVKAAPASTIKAPKEPKPAAPHPAEASAAPAAPAAATGASPPPGPAQEPAAQPRAMCPFVLSFGVGREFTVDAESKWEPFVWTASSCHMLMEARESKHSPPTNPVGKLGLVLCRS